MKKLPKIFQNEFNKPINNNKKVCYLKEEEQINNRLSSKVEEYKEEPIQDYQSIMTTLSKIFSGMGYSYNIPVTIETKNKTYNTNLIAKTNYHVITLDNEVIPISEILNITINSHSK